MKGLLKNISGAGAVSAGILASRVVGFARESLFAHYFGNSLPADAFRAALRIPNLLQNLFGEGVLSASFIPVYSRLRSEGKDREATELASGVLFLLSLVTAAITALGLIFTPLLIDLITPGFEGEVRELSITLVRILFPGVALLVLSAWCLGVQNSHRRFLLSYSAPVVWNLTIIGALLYFGREGGEQSITYVTWGVSLGCFFQLLVQLPTTLQLVGRLRGYVQVSNEYLRRVLLNFFPVVLGRGVVQISAFVDSIIASALPLGSLSALAYAQTIYLLPVSLFGMSVSAAELPELSSLKEEQKHTYIKRVEAALYKVLFFVLPSTAAFVFIGDFLVALVFQSGAFSPEDTNRVWRALAFLSLGLPLSTMSRIFSSFFYSRNEAGRLLWISLIRVGFSAAIGYALAVMLGYGLEGLCVATTVGAAFEFLLLALLLGKTLGELPALTRRHLFLAVLAVTAGILSRYTVVELTQWLSLSDYKRIVRAIASASLLGGIYLGGALLSRIRPMGGSPH